MVERGIKITRKHKALVYVIKTMNELVDKGIMKGKPFEVTEDGLELIKGFKPTNDEIKIAILKLKSMGYIGGE